MDIGEYALPILMVLCILAQIVSGHAILPHQFRREVISRSRNRPFFRVIIAMWIAVTVIVTAVIFMPVF